MRDGDVVYESQAHETQEPTLFLSLHDQGLPRAAEAIVIAQFVTLPPYTFAELGDNWIGIHLTTSNRLYVLARKRD
jgi:hypothetical protein